MLTLHLILLTTAVLLQAHEEGVTRKSYFEIFDELDINYRDLHLPRLDPSLINSIKTVDLSGRTYHIKTVGTTPPIFEIENFLTPEECDELISKAKKQGLEMSLVDGESLSASLETLGTLPLNEFEGWDLNNNSRIEMNEVKKQLEDHLDFFLNETRVKKLIRDLVMDFDCDGTIARWEFNQIHMPRLAKYVASVKVKNPHTKSRHSQQAWLDHPVGRENDVMLYSIEQRLSELTKLPMALIHSSESLQVVRYEPGGHYNCHLDSDHFVEEEIKDYTCCHLADAGEDCHVCRYATILYFLNEVDSGGETAFPIANNETFDSEIWGNDTERICDLARNCHKSNVVVKPTKGKAIFWYNHHVSNETYWLGETDFNSFHGGCDVVRGVKWIANQWLNVSPRRDVDIINWARMQERALKSDKEDDYFSLSDDTEES